LKTVSSDFAGAAFPPGTKVTFYDKTKNKLHGTVQRLLLRYARVASTEGTFWNVPYGIMEITETCTNPAMPLREIEAVGNQLMQEHEAKNELETGWNFGFDLAPARAGICRYKEKQISLSVTYCLKATKAEIRNTILHEIAHAIVGPKHGHDAVWKAVAGKIGCTAERCHRVEHTTPRWLGQCGCGKQWTRQRLTQRAKTGLCPACGDNIQWNRTGVE
jgi:predicted SprT family Zn-dependent metalloprotease